MTPAYKNTWEALRSLCDIHQFTYGRLGDELLWPASMPCTLAGSDAVPIANYGTSNAGLVKTVYRRGLGFRYGKSMQAIAGVHFNFSPPAAFWAAYLDHLRDARTEQRLSQKAAADRRYDGAAHGAT